MEPDLAEIRLRDFRPECNLRLRQNRIERSAHGSIDAHSHLGRWLTGGVWAVEDPAALVALMDEHNIATVVNLDGRWQSELDANLERYDRRFPGRFATFCHVDWRLLHRPDAEARLARSLRQSVDAGARGLKVWKDLGLHVRDGRGDLVLPDDPRLSMLWETAGRLKIPIAIHTADPVAFFRPLDASNERLEELLDHPDWHVAGARFPEFETLIGSLERLVAAHPGTAFIGVHAGCHAEDLSRVGAMLSRYRNFYIDIASRIAELGRQPRATADLISRFPDRVLFGTDQIPPQHDMYQIYFRFLETLDECFDYSPDQPPPTGRWTVSGLGLSDGVLRRIYFENAASLLTAAGPGG
jgi:predicted TIM-barrel fold metal-dependent hydrolase